MSTSYPADRPPRRVRGARLVVLGAAMALGAGLVSSAPAFAADQAVTGGSVNWGLKETFRSYVGSQTAALPPIGALPMGQRITLTSPAQFDTAGTPAAPANTSTPNESLPYTLPATAGTFTDAGNFTVQTSGGVNYHFPSHYFDISVSNVAVVVNGGAGSVVADVNAVVTGDFGDWQEGTYGGQGVTIASIDTANVSVAGSTLSVNASGVTLTQAGSEVLPLYAAGTAMDNLTLSASLADVPTTPTWNPQISVSKQTGFNPDGSETVTVTGTGFDPSANVSSRPPVTPGQPTGVYVVFGKFGDTWKPSASAPSSARKVITQKWALPASSKDQVSRDFPSQAAALVELSATGSFTTTLQVTPDEAATGNYGVYTYAAGGAAANAAQELSVPISFATATTPGEGEIDIDVTVPDRPVEPEPGEFVWRVDGGVSAVALGTAAVNGDHFAAGGQLAPIVVTDTRIGGQPWSVSASVGDFAGGGASFDGKHLGWTPAVTTAGAGAVAGGQVVSGFQSGAGLKESRTLGSAVAGHPLGTATMGAALNLQLPLSTQAGEYKGTLTLTAVS